MANALTNFIGGGFLRAANALGITQNEKNLSTYISKVQLQRLRHDVAMWRESIAEAENAWYPHRVKMQRMYIDTILSGHTLACINRRKELTLLKDWAFENEAGERNEDLKKILNKKWFTQAMEYALDAQFFGYSLISLGDLTDDSFNDLSIVRRWNVSPDRLNVAQFVYSISGVPFTEEPYSDWNIWVTTPSNIGIGAVGYGLLYNVALYEIMCRNLLGNNADASELYGMPVRVGTTSKTDGVERDTFEQALANMGSSGYILKDALDEVDLIESKGNGQGFKIYADFEARLEKKISKIILGHADALDSTPGKLGGGQGEVSPASQALDAKMQIDADFVSQFVNGELLPRLKKLGFVIPDGYSFAYVNDAEKEKKRVSEDVNNKATADIALAMKNAGLEMDANYFQERTGIPTTKSVVLMPVQKAGLSTAVENKLKKIYGK